MQHGRIFTLFHVVISTTYISSQVVSNHVMCFQISEITYQPLTRAVTIYPHGGNWIVNLGLTLEIITCKKKNYKQVL